MQNQSRGIVHLLLLAMLAIGVVLLGFLLFKRNSQPTPDKLLRAAQSAYDKSDYLTATAKYQDALKTNPSDHRALAGVLTSIASAGNSSGTEQKALQTALPYIAQASSSTEPTPSLLISIGYTYETAGQYQDALNYYNQALAKDPQNAYAYFRRGHTYQFLQENQAANADYDKAYQLDNTNGLIQLRHAQMTADSGQHDKAYSAYQAIAQAPTSSVALKSEALTNAGVLKRSEIIQINQAQTDLKKAYEADPTFAPAAIEYGFTMAINGDPKTGAALIYKGLTINPRISRGYYYLGLVQRLRKVPKDAIYYFQQGLDRVDTDNTILDNTMRAQLKGRFNYELAKTLVMNNGDSVNIALYFKNAINSDASLKEELKEELSKNAQFNLIKNNQQIRSLITS